MPLAGHIFAEDADPLLTQGVEAAMGLGVRAGNLLGQMVLTVWDSVATGLAISGAIEGRLLVLRLHHVIGHRVIREVVFARAREQTAQRQSDGK